MTHSISSNNQQQRVYTHYDQDGLADLLIGLGVLLAGLSMLLDVDVPLAALWVVLWLPLSTSARKSITARRPANVEAPPEQQKGIAKAALFVAGILLLLVAADMVVLWRQKTGNIPPWFLAGLRDYLTVILGLLGAIVISVMGWLSGLDRLYAYAVATAVVFVGGYLLNAPIALAVAVVGGIVMLWGLGLLVRFVRKYPKVPAHSGQRQEPSRLLTIAGVVLLLVGVAVLAILMHLVEPMWWCQYPILNLIPGC